MPVKALARARVRKNCSPEACGIGCSLQISAETQLQFQQLLIRLREVSAKWSWPHLTYPNLDIDSPVARGTWGRVPGLPPFGICPVVPLLLPPSIQSASSSREGEKC